MTEDLRKFIDQVAREWQNDELFEMANIHARRHGIANVVIWVGRAPKNHGLRVKVSNVPGRMDMEDSFVIMMPSLDYDYSAVAPWLRKKVPLILKWVKLNQDTLYSYETGELDDTDEFLDRLSPV